MKRISTLGAAIAGLAFALAPAGLAQTAASTSDPSHVEDQSKATEPSATQNNPDLGAKDPGRIGTSTRSNEDMNNNRYPTQGRTTTTQTTITQTTTAPVAAPEAVMPPSTTYSSASTTTPETTSPATSSTQAIDTASNDAAPAATLPRTASRVPLMALVGLAALAGALTLRARR